MRYRCRRAHQPITSAAGLAKAVNPIREGLNGDPLVWPKEAGAPKLLQDLVDQLALAIDGTQTVEQSLENAQSSWDKALT